MKRILLTCGVVMGALLAAFVAYRFSPFSRSTKSLRVAIVTEQAAEGVTGYRAIVENVGFMPVVVGRCETVSDAMERNIVLGDDIQQRKQNGQWETTLSRHQCRLVPMGIIEARFTNKLLWPHQQLRTSPFFPNVGVLRAFHHGDAVRFIVYTQRSEDSLASPHFIVE